MFFAKHKHVPEVKNYLIAYFYSRRHWVYSLTELGRTTIENAEETARAMLKEREDCELAEILEIKWEPTSGVTDIHTDNVSYVMAIYKKDISFGIALCEPDEVDPEGKIKRNTAFTYKKNFLAEFRTVGYTDVKINVHEYEIYADTLKECISNAKQKLWGVFAYRYACIYEARADKNRGVLIKILEKVNHTYELETESFGSTNGDRRFDEYLEITEIYQSLLPEVREETEFIEVSRRIERFSQHLERQERIIKSIEASQKEGYYTMRFTWPEAGDPFYVPAELLAKLKNRFKLDNLKDKTVICWYDQERVIYKIFPGYEYHL